MAQVNIENMRREAETFDRRDKAGWLDTFAPDAVMVPAHEWPENDPIHGAEAIWDFYLEVTAAWDDRPTELGEVLDVREDLVIANVRRDAHGKASGVAAAFSYWTVTTFRQGRKVRIEWFSERTAALEAAGLKQ
jgi:ketosteroid isomerase-like protein